MFLSNQPFPFDSQRNPLPVEEKTYLNSFTVRSENKWNNPHSTSEKIKRHYFNREKRLNGE